MVKLVRLVVNLAPPQLKVKSNLLYDVCVFVNILLDR